MPKSNLSVHIPFYRQTKRHGFGETTHHDWRVMDISRGSERVPVTSGKDIVSSGGVDIIQGRHSPRSESFKCHVIRDVGGDGLTRSVVGGRERNHVSPQMGRLSSSWDPASYNPAFTTTTSICYETNLQS